MFLLIDDLVMFLNEVFKSLPTVLGVREEVHTLPTTTPAPLAQVRNSKFSQVGTVGGTGILHYNQYIHNKLFIVLLSSILAEWLGSLISSKRWLGLLVVVVSELGIVATKSNTPGL